jgi:hypothetical protein
MKSPSEKSKRRALFDQSKREKRLTGMKEMKGLHRHIQLMVAEVDPNHPLVRLDP